jgi:hypothetical protein
LLKATWSKLALSSQFANCTGVKEYTQDELCRTKTYLLGKPCRVLNGTAAFSFTHAGAAAAAAAAAAEAATTVAPS